MSKKAKQTGGGAGAGGFDADGAIDEAITTGNATTQAGAAGSGSGAAGTTTGGNGASAVSQASSRLPALRDAADETSTTASQVNKATMAAERALGLKAGSDLVSPGAEVWEYVADVVHDRKKQQRVDTHTYQAARGLADNLRRGTRPQKQIVAAIENNASEC